MISFYFGKKVSQYITIDDYAFENGSYMVNMALGETYVFLEIDKLYDLGNSI